MKILYAIQGTGNGHISRALELIPALQEIGEIDILLSGTQSNIQLPWPIKHRFHGISFVFGEKGNVSIKKTAQSLRPIQFIRDLLYLPLAEYDLIISDFEPISAWASLIKNKSCLGISHQAAFRSTSIPRPKKKALFAQFILKYYAYTTHYIGFHFKSYEAEILPPIIRSKIRNAESSNKGHITVYLPAYADAFLMEQFASIPGYTWELFSKHATEKTQLHSVVIYPIDSARFTESLISCHGLITGGGFETPAEAMYLGKKIMLIPMLNQYEQLANALAAKQLGCDVVSEINPRFTNLLMKWLEFGKPVKQDFPDIIPSLITQIQDFNRSEEYPTKPFSTSII